MDKIVEFLEWLLDEPGRVFGAVVILIIFGGVTTEIIKAVRGVCP